MKHYHIKTFGCQMNVYDSQKIGQIMEGSLGITPTDSVDSADIIIFNTCSIREKAQEKLFSEIGRLKNLTKNKKDLIIAVGGCVASQEGSEILKRSKLIHIIFGPQTLHRLPALISQYIQSKIAQIDISFPLIEKFDQLPLPRKESPSAFVSIMEGCSKYCSYCVVPYTRGEEISRPFDDVLAEVSALADQGVKEIILLGQNVNDYRGRMHQGGYANLALLIHYISAIDSVLRIRYTTSHPKAFTQDLIDAYQEPKLANQLHLPVQSGSDRILSLMKRGYTRTMFMKKIEDLRKIRPDISVTSDFIVGFPGETEQDFKQTLNLVKEIGFDQSYSFIYSARPGTPAASILDETTMSEKKERLHRLQSLLTKNTQQYSQKMCGTNQHIIIDRISKKRNDFLSGRTENNRVVNFQAPLNLIGSLAKVHITHAHPNSLMARFIEHYP